MTHFPIEIHFELLQSMAEIVEHEFLQSVPKNPCYIKSAIVRRLNMMLEKDFNAKGALEATTRNGRLKMERKNKGRLDQTAFLVKILIVSSIPYRTTYTQG